MLDDIQRAYQIEGAVGEGQCGYPAEDDLRAALVKLHQCRRTDVHKLRTLDRQAGPQAWRNLEPSTVIGQQGSHERPGIELLRLHQAGAGP